MSRLNATAYDISRPTGQCAATGKPFEPGDAVVVALVERREDEGFDRLDYLADAWTDDARQSLGRRVFAVWRTRQPEPDAPKRLLIDDDALLDLFLQLCEGDDDTHAGRDAFRFVLALILCRKRLLKRLGSDGGTMLVRPRGSDPESPPIRVTEPELDVQTLRAVTEQLDAVVRGDA